MSLKLKLCILFSLVFVAAIVMSSNMGFKLNYSLTTNPAGNNVNWASIPYFHNYTTDESLCNDVNTDCPGAASSITYFDTANNATVVHGCGYTSDFNIQIPKAYGISVASACTWKIVGSHDDSYDSTNGVQFQTNPAGNNVNWISVPYHTQAVNDEALCNEINTQCGAITSSITYFDTVNNATVVHGCGYASDFNLSPGRGYGISVSASCPAPGWHPSHY